MRVPLSIRSIVAATDLSRNSTDALQAAASLAASTGAELHVVYALEPWREPTGEALIEMQRRIHDARASLRAEVDRLIPREPGASSVRVVLGRASAAILNRAGQVGADLIVMGPHRARAFGDRVLGTTADQVLREAVVPCLIVRGPLASPVRRIVVPTDLSHAARATLAVAMKWGEALQGPAAPADGVELTVLHVADEITSVGSQIRNRFQRWTELRHHSESAMQTLGPVPTLRIEQEVLHGSSPADEILRYAEEAGAELLVMSTRGERPLVKALLASVSAAVARTTGIPLLLVPPPVWNDAAVAAPEESGALVGSV